MKKLVSFIVAFALAFSVAYAETDLSAMSYNELIDLRNKLNKEIMSRPEWKEVEVPAGEWIIGKDIPSGFYCLKSTKELNIVRIEDKNGSQSGLYKTLDENEIVGKVEFKDGLIFTCWHPVLLSPPISLGF